MNSLDEFKEQLKEAKVRYAEFDFDDEKTKYGVEDEIFRKLRLADQLRAAEAMVKAQEREEMIFQENSVRRLAEEQERKIRIEFDRVAKKHNSVSTTNLMLYRTNIMVYRVCAVVIAASAVWGAFFK